MGLYVEDEDLVYFRPDHRVYVRGRSLTVREIRRGKRGHEVAFLEVTSRDAAEELRGSDVLAPERRRLGENEYWPDDLIGLGVRPGGGVVSAISYGTAQDRLVIERHETTFEVPFVDELVPVVDVAAGYVEIVEIDGLSEPSDRA